MSGDWIKMRVDLDGDPAVELIASSVGLEPFAVIGRLWKVWSWADQQLRDGYAVNVTAAFLNRFTQCEGFAEAMQQAGWLKILSTGISFPNFDRHNGKPAKNRALAKNRMKRFRYASVTPNASLEKRRVLPPKPPVIPTGWKTEPAQAQAAARALGIKPPKPGESVDSWAARVHVALEAASASREKLEPATNASEAPEAKGNGVA